MGDFIFESSQLFEAWKSPSLGPLIKEVFCIVVGDSN
jgi:hypothetical protein